MANSISANTADALLITTRAAICAKPHCFFSAPLASFFNDKEFHELSLAVQEEEYFSSRTREELKIMRNSIFARYGLIFQPGGEMEQYFRGKDWYRPFLNDVGNCLTTI